MTLLNEQAYDYLHAYLTNQVVGSVQNIATVTSRWNIVKDFFSESIVLWILLVIFLIIKRKQIKQLAINKDAIALLLIVFSGVLPIMLSMKQRGFYILSVFPFLAIAIAMILAPPLEELLNKWSRERRAKTQKVLFVLSIILCLGLIGFYPKKSISRDKDLIEVTDMVNKHVPNWGRIGVDKRHRNGWGLIGYMARYGGYSLYVDDPNMDYYIVEKGKDKFPPNTKVVDESSSFYLVKTVSQ